MQYNVYGAINIVSDQPIEGQNKMAATHSDGNTRNNMVRVSILSIINNNQKTLHFHGFSLASANCWEHGFLCESVHFLLKSPYIWLYHQSNILLW